MLKFQEPWWGERDVFIFGHSFEGLKVPKFQGGGYFFFWGEVYIYFFFLDPFPGHAVRTVILFFFLSLIYEYFVLFSPLHFNFFLFVCFFLC